jgi:hypothetical protein
LFALGRWIVIATQGSVCLLLLLCGTLGVYSAATGNSRLRLNEPWDSIVLYSIFIPWIVVCIFWFLFCLWFAMMLRRHHQAGSLRQAVAIHLIAVPYWGLIFYDRKTREFLDEPNH